MGAYESNYQPDLLVTSEDIEFLPVPGEPTQPVTISATIWNTGELKAQEVLVVFKDFDDVIGSQVIPAIEPNDINTVSMQYMWDEASFRLITVEIDPSNTIIESDEENNTGSKLYQVGDPADMDAVIEISCYTASCFDEDDIAGICGKAKYRISIEGYPDYVDPVKRGIVLFDVIDFNGQIFRQGQTVTDTAGNYNISFPVPGNAGDIFSVNVTVTDGTLEGLWQKTFNVCQIDQKDLAISDLIFDNTEPNANDMIIMQATVSTASDNISTVTDIPVTFYAYNTSTGSSSQIDSTQFILTLEAGNSDSVSISWTPQTEGRYRITAKIGPSYSDDNHSNNYTYANIQVGPFTIAASPRWAEQGQVVQITVDSRTAMLNDQLGSIEVMDSAGQPIVVTPADPYHPTATRWIYETELLPQAASLGRTSITVYGSGINSSYYGYGYFYIVDVLPDFWIPSTGITFLPDESLDIGDTVTIQTTVHADIENTVPGIDIPVTFYAKHPAGDYKIGQTQYTGQLAPGSTDTVSLQWTNAAEGWYVIEVELGPDFSDRNHRNNQATHAISVGNIPPFAICQDIELPVDENCEGIVLPEDVDNGSYDPDGDPITLSLDPLGPYPLGDTLVELIVTDETGLSSSCQATITVNDTTPPDFTTVPANRTVQRDGNGNIAQLNEWLASTVEAVDNCGSVSYVNDFSSFPYECGNTGSVTVTWTATDGYGNSTPTSATFTIDDPTEKVTYDGDLLLSTEGAATVDANLTAILRDGTDNLLDIDGEDVTFTLVAEGINTIIESTSTENGVANVVLSLEPAIYAIEVTLGCSDITTSAYLVIYNPQGGFATGGGWLIPEDDGLNTYPDVKTHFEFRVEYDGNVMDPSSTFEFRYQDNFVDLQSTVIERLVVTGGKIAQFKGWAVVNGIPGNWFFVKAIDNGSPGKNNDVFDIKIWSPGVDPEGDPTERAGGVINAGNIVVHAK